MRPMTFILLILILLVAGVAVVYFFISQMNGGRLGDIVPGAATPVPLFTEENDNEVGQVEPQPTATPAIRFVPVVVARVPLAAGQRLTAELMSTELRPDDNVAVQVNVTVQNMEELVGQIVKKDIPAGKEILRPFLALQATDLAMIGSDLALYVDQGRVAIAFPIDRYSGVAYSLRPGDQVDVLMSLNILELDEEFQTVLPNHLARVDRFALEEGTSFLFASETEGRLELLDLVNLVAQIGPQGGLNAVQIPRRVTQLTLQQANVIWVGNWRSPADLEQAFQADVPVAGAAEGQPAPPDGPIRPEAIPDLVILGVSLQDALTLNWAQIVGIDVQLALRAQGDNSIFVTTSVSLPQMAEQGPLTLPAPGVWGLEPRVDLVPTPGLPEPEP
jgi:Flp pilus assembly protein CpaB